MAAPTLNDGGVAPPSRPQTNFTGEAFSRAGGAHFSLRLLSNFALAGRFNHQRNLILYVELP
jgi:hypothetical protein